MSVPTVNIDILIRRPRNQNVSTKAPESSTEVSDFSTYAQQPCSEYTSVNDAIAIAAHIPLTPIGAALFAFDQWNS